MEDPGGLCAPQIALHNKDLFNKNHPLFGHTVTKKMKLKWESYWFRCYISVSKKKKKQKQYKYKNLKDEK